MTFQDAQTQFATTVKGVAPELTSSELVQKQRDLQNLLAQLPNTPEFDPIASAISEYSPKLKGQVTQAVVKALQSRDAVFTQASHLFAQISTKADADARNLTFEKPKLILATLADSVEQLQQIRNAATAGDSETAGSKAEALALMLIQVQQTLKTS